MCIHLKEPVAWEMEISLVENFLAKIFNSRIASVTEFCDTNIKIEVYAGMHGTTVTSTNDLHSPASASVNN